MGVEALGMQTANQIVTYIWTVLAAIMPLLVISLACLILVKVVRWTRNVLGSPDR